MTNDQLAVLVAERIMGWTAGPERFMLGDRRWLPRWRFQPGARLQDALSALERAKPKDYSFGAADGGGFWARVRVGGTVGEAHESGQARAITIALARALDLEIPGNSAQTLGRTSRHRSTSNA